MRVYASPVPGPDEITALHELRVAIDRVLDALTSREALVVRRYYGFEGDGCTQAELGAQLGISRERIHQIIVKALRKLRHPTLCRILRPHAALQSETKISRAEQEAQETQRAEQIAEAIRQANAYQIRDALHHRIGDEIGADPRLSWWSDDRRRDIADALDRVTWEVGAEMCSSDEVLAYFRDHLKDWWRIYDAWKRDVRRRLHEKCVKLTCGFKADGSYLIYARNDRYTWYLFDVPYEQGTSAFRWVGYVARGDDEARRGRIKALDRSMRLRISYPACSR